MVDEAALLAFAQANPEARFALDCFDHEPLPKDDPIRGLPNAILTPHLAGHTIDTHRAGRRIGIDLIVGILAGVPPSAENLGGQAFASGTPRAAVADTDEGGGGPAAAEEAAAAPHAPLPMLEIAGGAVG